MPSQNSPTQNALSEPKSYRRDESYGDDPETASDRVARERAWLREQLLAGMNSPLCDPITPAYFERLRARARGEL